MPWEDSRRYALLVCRSTRSPCGSNGSGWRSEPSEVHREQSCYEGAHQKANEERQRQRPDRHSRSTVVSGAAVGGFKPFNRARDERASPIAGTSRELCQGATVSRKPGDDLVGTLVGSEDRVEIDSRGALPACLVLPPFGVRSFKCTFAEQLRGRRDRNDFPDPSARRSHCGSWHADVSCLGSKPNQSDKCLWSAEN